MYTYIYTGIHTDASIYAYMERNTQTHIHALMHTHASIHS